MSYQTNPETTAPQIERNSLQELAKVPVEWYLHFALLFCLVAGSLPVWGGVCAMLAVRFVFWKIAKDQELREATARAAAWCNICGPVVISSIHPGETVFELKARADEFRANLALSGNPYAAKIPVIEYPYNPMLVEHGQLQLAWTLYQKSVGEFQHIQNLQWYERGCPNELKGLFANSVLPAPKQQE